MGWWARSRWGQKDAAANLAVVNGADTPVKLVDAPGGRKKIIVDDIFLSWHDVGISAAAGQLNLYSGDPDGGGVLLLPMATQGCANCRNIPLRDLGLRVVTNTELWAEHKSSGGLGTYTLRVSVSYHIEPAGAE